LSTGLSAEHLEDGLDLGVDKRVGSRGAVSVESVDSGLLSGEQGGSRVGTVGDERVERVGHLKTEAGSALHQCAIT
jgi:hypothetical protein